jgi:hypothetical protein
MTERSDGDQLVRAVDRLVNQVGHWTPARWAVPTTSTGDRSRAEVVHALAQRLADLEADVTGRPEHPVPRLANDLALPDQVRVMTLDLVMAGPGPAVLAAAINAVTTAQRQL